MTNQEAVPGPIARNIVSQLGDLYMDFTHPATPERNEFVKYRQATNDQADTFVESLLREYGAAVLRDAAAERQTRECATPPAQIDAKTVSAGDDSLNSPNDEGETP